MTDQYIAQCAMPSEEAVRLKFEQTLDDVVNHILIHELAKQIINSGKFITYSERSSSSYDTIFKARIEVKYH